MKKILISFFVFILFVNYVSSQEVGDVIKLDAEVIPVSKSLAFTGISLSEENKTEFSEYLHSYLKYTVVSIDNTNQTVKLRALKIKPFKEKKKERYLKKYGKKLIDLSDFYDYKIYTISKSDFDAYAKVVPSKVVKERLSFGLLTLPFKARPQDDFSFDSEFNLNTTLNIRIYSFSETSLNLQLGGGIGTVGLNTSNADGLSANEAQDVSTLTLLTGAMFEYKNVQVGIYMGADNINNQSNYKWKSNGNVWFGFGVGYDLFNIAVSESDNQNQSN